MEYDSPMQQFFFWKAPAVWMSVYVCLCVCMWACVNVQGCPLQYCSWAKNQTLPNCPLIRKWFQKSYSHSVRVCSVACHVQLFVNLRTVAHQAPLSMMFSRQEYWSGLPFPPLGDLSNTGIKPMSPALQASSFTTEPPGKCLAMKINEKNLYISDIQRQPRCVSEKDKIQKQGVQCTTIFLLIKA